MKKQYSIKQIKKKLQWFHGEEFNKYPFIDDIDNPDGINGSNK